MGVKEEGKATVKRLVPAPYTKAAPEPFINSVIMAATTKPGLEGIKSSTEKIRVADPMRAAPRTKVLTRPRVGRK